MAAPQRLSILVPTFCRAADVEQLLRHLASEPAVAAGEVPILGSDNASTDCTADALRGLQAELDGVDLRVHSQPENVGAVRNMTWLAANAPETEHVWILGD